MQGESLQKSKHLWLYAREARIQHGKSKNQILLEMADGRGQINPMQSIEDTRGIVCFEIINYYLDAVDFIY